MRDKQRDEDKAHSHLVADSEHHPQYRRQAFSTPELDEEDVPRGKMRVVQHYVDHAGRPTTVQERDGRTDVIVGDDQPHLYWPDGPARRKWDLVQRAEALGSTPWQEALRECQRLRDEWKDAGSADRSTESVLWPRFQAAQDLHFRARDQHNDEAKRIKERLVSRAEALVSRDDRSAGDESRALMDEWKRAPRASKADEDALWAKFNSAREKRKERLARAHDDAKRIKERLVSEANTLARSTDWKAAGERFRKMMDEWKAAPRAGKADEDRLGRDFTKARTTFHDARTKHFDSLERDRRAAESKKRGLIAAAQSAAASSDLRNATDKMRSLQEEWKRAGRADKKVEDDLWKQFKRAQDTLYQRKTQERGKREQAAAKAKATKTQIIAEAQRLARGPDFRANKDQMRALMEQWKAAGRAAREDEDRLWNQFKAAKDSLFENAKAAGDQRRREAAARLHDAIERKRDSLRNIDDRIRQLEQRYHEMNMRPEPSWNNPRRWEIASKRNAALSNVLSKKGDLQSRRYDLIQQISEMEAKWRGMV